MPGEAASELLRSALPKLKGSLLIGVVNSLGKRRDAASIPALTKMMLGPDPDLAAAAASALGQIGTLAAAKELGSALGKSTGANRTAIADAGLVCAERLLADEKRAEAFALYTALSAPDMPKPVRLAAMSGIIREETSVGRPR
jgi:HEAT repeat protein